MPDNLPSFRIKNCAVTPGRCALDVGAHRQLGVYVYQIVMIVVGMARFVDPLNGVTVIVELDDVIVEDDEPIAE